MSNGSERTPEHPALTVGCPDCSSPAGVPCIGQGDGPHPARSERAEVQGSRQAGTCTHPRRDGTPCGRTLIRYQQHGLTRVLHAPDVDCPPFPDPRTDWNGYAAMLGQGLEPQKPPVSAWQPTTGPGAQS